MLTLGIPLGESSIQMQHRPSKVGHLSALLSLCTPPLPHLDNNAHILSNRTSSPTSHKLFFDLNAIY